MRPNAALRAHRCKLLDPRIAEYRGRIVKTTGESSSPFRRQVVWITGAPVIGKDIPRHHNKFSNGEIFNQQRAAARSRAGAAEYQSVASKEDRDQTDSDLDPKASLAQAQERPGQTVFAG